MPRQPRYFLPDMPQHVIQRGVDRQDVFFCDQDYRHYKTVLLEAAQRYDCDIHAYVLMTNHVHLLVTPRSRQSLPLVMQAIGRCYVQKTNRRHGRTGTLWEGRYKASLVQSDRYALACYRYIELNPVRASMVRSPADYAYSSYRCNALGNSDALVTKHETYESLGKNSKDRQLHYRELFNHVLNSDILTSIRDTTNACRVLGNDRFQDQVELVLGRSVRPAKVGRPARGQRGQPGKLRFDPN